MLDGDALHVTYRVENRGEGPMAFGLGGHPGFNVPLAPGLAFDYSPAPARVVDTTGAGDSFDAGLLYGLATNMDLRDAVALGAACAAKTIAIMGPHGFWEMKL